MGTERTERTERTEPREADRPDRISPRSIRTPETLEEAEAALSLARSRIASIDAQLASPPSTASDWTVRATRARSAWADALERLEYETARLRAGNSTSEEVACLRRELRESRAHAETLARRLAAQSAQIHAENEARRVKRASADAEGLRRLWEELLRGERAILHESQRAKQLLRAAKSVPAAFREAWNRKQVALGFPAARGAEEAGAGLVATGLKDLARELVEQETREETRGGEAS